MDNLAPVMSGVSQRDEEQGKLIGFAWQIANGWAEQLGVNKDAVVWVALKGGSRTPIMGTGANAAIHRLDNDVGIAFVLGSAGVMDLLFVVTRRRVGYSVSISNHANQGDRSERHDVRPDYSGDVKYLLAAAKKYVLKVPRVVKTLEMAHATLEVGQ